MHLATAFITVIASWKYGNWKNYKHYSGTLFFMSTFAFMYEYLAKNYTLWTYSPELTPYKTLPILLHGAITLPLSTFVYLSTFPSTSKLHSIIHVVKLIGIFSFVEWTFIMSGRIRYENGWCLLYSVLFNAVMFPMLLLHQKKPVWAYPICFCIICFLMWFFKVPID